MYKNIYSSFKHWYNEKGTIWIYSDPHFSDIESYKIRFPEEFNFEGCDVRPSDEWIAERLDEMQIKNINKVCGRDDTLIILGDVGNANCVSKLRARHKVLILGNHDKGANNYIHISEVHLFPFSLNDEQKTEIKKIKDSWPLDGPGDWAGMNNDITEYTNEQIKNDFVNKHVDCNLNTIQSLLLDEHKKILTKYDSKTDSWSYACMFDNKLFDEVYEGKLQIAPKVVLSHMPVTDEYSLNIHGHVHDKQKAEVKYYEVNDKIIRASFNCCAESINYTPVNLTKLLTSGCLKPVPSQYRETIDRATAEKLKKE